MNRVQKLNIILMTIGLGMNTHLVAQTDSAAVARLVKIGKLPVSLQAGAGYWVESPAAGPEGWS